MSAVNLLFEKVDNMVDRFINYFDEILLKLKICLSLFSDGNVINFLCL